MNIFRKLIDDIDPKALERAVNTLRMARDTGGVIYIAGNGGSAATATHLANDLGKATKVSGLNPIRALSMSDNVSWLTALGNDEGYDRVFAGQMENFAKPGDVLIAISTSGNSANLVRAVELARETGVRSIGVLGFEGGRLKDMVDECIWLPSPVGAYGPVESAHSVVVDLINACLMADRPLGMAAE
ncbi:SIS domain-containing protein [Halovulum dunhuangense]|uniref:SIS domain-containing protein n=1 Tax=Halovulum dunhuangense TaxID=1505036 RepID=A0A849L246_9RHOB|nr:SIS domain-containing protein [Halovulum dunhuangense]NNU80312.1 SIS domain-containing protein [Halovulum dunhuangense]